MKKILFIFALFYSNASFAACFAVTGATTDCAQATDYQVSVSKVELCADAACTSAVTVADTTASFDIATVAVGAQVGAYANLNTVPVGTYTHIRSTVSSTITYAGDATANCTAKTSTTATLTSSGGVVNADLAAADLQWAVIDQSLYHLVALSAPLTISKTSFPPQVSIDFSTADGHLCVNGASFPGPPVMAVTVTPN